VTDDDEILPTNTEFITYVSRKTWDWLMAELDRPPTVSPELKRLRDKGRVIPFKDDDK
jgi:uncharacterized protein (DUF1778 family)